MGFLGCLSSTFTILVMIAYVIFLPIAFWLMTYGDYEKWDCYASPDYNEPWLSEPTEAPPEDYSDHVTQRFAMLNAWGLYNFIAPFGIGILFLLSTACLKMLGSGRYTMRRCVTIQTSILFLLLVLSFLSQLIAVVVIRFGHSGRVCSGDYASELSFFSLEQRAPYLHLTGTWLFYYAATLLYGTAVAVTGLSFIVGVKQ